MATVLICESEPDVGALLALQLRRLGHDPVLYAGSWSVPLDDIDVLLVEPGGHGIDVARELLSRAPQIPIVCSSIYPPNAETDALEPVRYLVKPFPASALDCAIRAAVTGRHTVA